MASRRAAARTGLAFALAAALAACGSSGRTAAPGAASPSSSQASTAAPGASAGPAASSQVPSSAAPSTVPSSAGPSGAIDPGASPVASAVAGRWRTVVPPLAVPAAYLDFGFAANGDVVVVATDDVTDAKLGLWVARYSPNGTRISKKTVDRRISAYAGDWIDIDPSNGTVLFSERDAGTTSYTGRRISVATGQTIASINFNDEVKRVAIDDSGRLWAISPFYPTYNNRRPCIVDRLGSGGGITGGVDHWLGTCEERGFDDGPAVFGDPSAIEVGRDGRLLIVDTAPAGRRGDAKAAGLALTVLSSAFDLVRQWNIPLEWKPSDLPYATWSQSLSLAGGSNGDVFLGEVIISADGTRSTGWRVRTFDRDGRLLATLGVGGDQAGVTFPVAPNVDADGRLWVIDLDTATRSYSIKVLE